MFEPLIQQARKCNPTLASSVAVALCCALLATGCTPPQQQTAVQVVTQIDTHIPEVVAAADTAAATIAALVPSDAAIVGVTDVAFDTAAKTLQGLCASYLANPTAGVFAQIQAAIASLEGQVNTATLNSVKISDPAHQSAILAALKGLLTIVTVVFAIAAPTLSTAQVAELRNRNIIHLERVRSYMDQHELQAYAKSSGVDLDRSFRMAAAAGF